MAIYQIVKWHHGADSHKIFFIFILSVATSFFKETKYILGYGYPINLRVIDCPDVFVYLSQAPILLLYFKSITRIKWFKPADTLWLLPAIAVSVSLLLYFQFSYSVGSSRIMDVLLDDRYQNGQDPTYNYILWAYYTTAFIQWVVIFYLSRKILLNYHKRLLNFYSYLDDKSMELNVTSLTCTMLAAPLMVFFIFATREYCIEHKLLIITLYALLTTAFVVMFIADNKMKFGVKDFVADVRLNGGNTFDASELYIANPAGETTSYIRMHYFNKLKSQLQHLMVEGKVYLDSTLKIDQLARKMDSNRTYLSYIINKYYNKSFSDFINCYRVEYAKNLMMAHPDMKQDEIARKSGFMSASTYCKAFKKCTGISPSEWRKRM